MKIDLYKIMTLGSGLLRPEGVMAADDGTVYASDGRGCCSELPKAGKQSSSAIWAGYRTGFASTKKATASSPISAAAGSSPYLLKEPPKFL